MINSRTDININANEGRGNVFIRGNTHIDSAEIRNLTSPAILDLRHQINELRKCIKGLQADGVLPHVVPASLVPASLVPATTATAPTTPTTDVAALLERVNALEEKLAAADAGRGTASAFGTVTGEEEETQGDTRCPRHAPVSVPDVICEALRLVQEKVDAMEALGIETKIGHVRSNLGAFEEQLRGLTQRFETITGITHIHDSPKIAAVESRVKSALDVAATVQTALKTVEDKIRHTTQTHTLATKNDAQINVLAARVNTMQDSLQALDARVQTFVARTDERMCALEAALASVGTTPTLSAEVAAAGGSSDAAVPPADASRPKAVQVVLRRVPSDKVVRYAW